VDERGTEELLDVLDAAGDQKPEALLNFVEVPDPSILAYGDEYNQKLLNYLAQVQANRAEEMDKEGPKSIFGWLHDNVAQEDGAFNADADGIRPVSGSTLKSKKAEPVAPTAPTGNFDSRIAHASKTYRKGDTLKKIEGNAK
jgi:hypothetical protein